MYVLTLSKPHACGESVSEQKSGVLWETHAPPREGWLSHRAGVTDQSRGNSWLLPPAAPHLKPGLATPRSFPGPSSPQSLSAVHGQPGACWKHSISGLRQPYQVRTCTVPRSQVTHRHFQPDKHPSRCSEATSPFFPI